MHHKRVRIIHNTIWFRTLKLTLMWGGERARMTSFVQIFPDYGVSKTFKHFTEFKIVTNIVIRI